jgi:hypothetical protein
MVFSEAILMKQIEGNFEGMICGTKFGVRFSLGGMPPR